jgi:cytochrome P450
MDRGVIEDPAADFDPLDPELVASPHTEFDRLRTDCPVARGGRWGGFWALLNYADIVAASTAPGTFSSAEGIVVPANPVGGRRAPMHYDPPEHTRYRRALNPPFRQENVDPLADGIRATAAELVGALAAAGGGDAIAAFASPFATRVLLRFLNIPDAQADSIRSLSERFEQAQKAEDREAAQTISTALYDVARQAVAARRAHPLPAELDVVSGLLADDAGLDDEFVAGTVRQLLIAGHVPVVLLCGSAVLHLAGDADLQRSLRATPELIGDAVEEFLRLYTPNEGFARTATRDTELGGRTVRAGERVAMVYTSANRDPAVFPDPHELRIGRTPNRHLAFGHGVHKCVGTTLARMEIRIALRELLAAGPFELDGEPTWSHWPEYGPHTVPLRFTSQR